MFDIQGAKNKLAQFFLRHGVVRPRVTINASPRPDVPIRRLPTRHGRRTSAPPISWWCPHMYGPRTHSTLDDRSFGVAGPRLWNSLPAELRQQDIIDICLTEFSRLLKSWHFCSLRLGALWLLCLNGAGNKHSYLYLLYVQQTSMQQTEQSRSQYRLYMKSNTSNYGVRQTLGGRGVSGIW